MENNISVNGVPFQPIYRLTNYTWQAKKPCKSQAQIQTPYLLPEVQTAATMVACTCAQGHAKDKGQKLMSEENINNTHRYEIK
jgi:hypothetical protein